MPAFGDFTALVEPVLAYLKSLGIDVLTAASPHARSSNPAIPKGSG